MYKQNQILISESYSHREIGTVYRKMDFVYGDFFTVYRQISQSETTKRKNICQRGQKSSKVFLVVRDKANFMHVIYKPEALLFVGRGYVAQYTIPGFFEDAERFEIEFGLR